MKNPLRLLPLIFAALAFALGVAALPIYAADVVAASNTAAAVTITAADPATTSMVDGILQTVAGALLGKFGWAGKLFGILGTIAAAARFFVKPAWALIFPQLEAYVKSTPDTADDERLHRFLGNPIVKGFLFVLDVITSLKIPTPPAK